MRRAKATIGLLFALCCLAVCTAPGAHAALSDPRDARDPLGWMVRRIDAFLHREEVDGVTLDPRTLGNLPEEIRLSVVPQLLAYCELYRAHPNAAHYDDIVARADYLIHQFHLITSGTAADGMLGYALLSAYEITGNPRYLMPGVMIVRRAQELKGYGLNLNWGLMAALALAKYHQLGGDAQALAKAREIVSSVAAMQNADGSMPHVCEGSEDVHYTAWMSMELIQLHPLMEDPLIPRMLTGTYGFLKGRVGADGVPSYEDPPELGRAAYYYAPANGCVSDYDTRGWVNELGYDALLFDRFADARYLAVMDRLLGLEDSGAFPDKWGYFPAPDDPIYPWADASRSVIRTSLVFWSLSALHADRERGKQARYVVADRATAPVAQDLEAGERASMVEALGGTFPFSPDGVFLGEAVPDTVPAPRTAVDPTTSRASTHAEGAAATSPHPSAAARGEGLDLALSGSGPVRGAATIRFSIPERDQVSLRIYDVAGRGVRGLWHGFADRGGHEVVWDGRDDAGRGAQSGLYFVRLEAGRGVRSARLLWLR